MAKKDKNKPVDLKPEKPAKDKSKKNKKDKNAAATPPAGAPAQGANANGTPSVPLANLSPDQMTTAQLEQAIKESNDPGNRLKKLRSPLNIKSCLLNILILIVVTFAIVVFWCWLAVDKFNFAHVMSDMMDKFGITSFFKNMGSTISGWFS
ncbi:MAG: hypothetical protein J1G01_04750 [Clostridiales bacterium]|nr:hypothetical protein [Clostridiales bacterium]